jgi:hypothetical protein
VFADLLLDLIHRDAVFLLVYAGLLGAVLVPVACVLRRRTLANLDPMADVQALLGEPESPRHAAWLPPAQRTGGAR